MYSSPSDTTTVEIIESLFSDIGKLYYVRYSFDSHFIIAYVIEWQEYFGMWIAVTITLSFFSSGSNISLIIEINN